MQGDALLTALDAYISVLYDASSRTRRAEDRNRYRGHLANAAILFHLLRRGDISGAKERVLAERRTFGTDFLDGAEGAATESAFVTFADLIAGLR